MLPQLGLGRSYTDADKPQCGFSVKIARGTLNVTETIIGPSEFGKKVPLGNIGSHSPHRRAAATKSRDFTDIILSPDETGDIDPMHQADGEDN